MDRVSFVMRVKPGQQEEYIRRHQNVWPDVLAEHRRAGIRKMAIYMKGDDLFLYMEVDDYPKAVRILSQSPASLRWEEYMAPIMEDSGGQDYDPTNAYPPSLPEVFYWEPGTNQTDHTPAAESVLSAPSFANGSSTK
jgi:L-rhamnose mutarotase